MDENNKIQNGADHQRNLTILKKYLSSFILLAFFFGLSCFSLIFLLSSDLLSEVKPFEAQTIFILGIIEVSLSFISFITCAVPLLYNIGKKVFTKGINERFNEVGEFTKSSQKNMIRNGLVISTISAAVIIFIGLIIFFSILFVLVAFR